MPTQLANYMWSHVSQFVWFANTCATQKHSLHIQLDRRQQMKLSLLTTQLLSTMSQTGPQHSTCHPSLLTTCTGPASSSSGSRYTCCSPSSHTPGKGRKRMQAQTKAETEHTNIQHVCSDHRGIISVHVTAHAHSCKPNSGETVDVEKSLYAESTASWKSL